MELAKKIASIFSQFQTNYQFKNFEIFNSGHINDTYLIRTEESVGYVLQKMNGRVFTQAKDVIENKIKVTQYLHEKGIQTLEFVPVKQNVFYIKDSENNFWNLSKFIKNSHTYLKVESNKIAYEAGLATADFLANTTNFNKKLVEIIPNFHSMSFRFQEFENSLDTAFKERIQKAQKWIDFATENKNEMMVIEQAINQHKIPLRVTHNDTKVSNILFDKNNKAICLIDLDTVMKGCIHFDYGDALRTICSSANEDEKETSVINFNLDYFKNYTKGFLKNISNNISDEEIKYLPKSIEVMTFIIALRFLTDYLNNDTYFKTNHTEQNLERAINQFTFVNKIREHKEEIHAYISKIYMSSCH